MESQGPYDSLAGDHTDQRQRVVEGVTALTRQGSAMETNISTMHHTLLYWFPRFSNAGAAGLYLGLADAWSSSVFGAAMHWNR